MSTIILGDCLDYLRSLPDNSIDLLLTDPPYGIGIAKAGHVGRGTLFAKKAWDANRPTPEYFLEMLRVSRNQIIWGGNYFADYLPPSRCWLVWYKRDGLPVLSFADCELAWTSFDRTAMVFNCRWYGFVKDSREKKVHPAQKALAVMEWCIHFTWVSSGNSVYTRRGSYKPKHGYTSDCFNDHNGRGNSLILAYRWASGRPEHGHLTCHNDDASPDPNCSYNLN